METNEGIITKLHISKGYGFIRDDAGKSYFFHAVGVESPSFEKLREGMPVSFLAADNPKGPRAIAVVAS